MGTSPPFSWTWKWDNFKLVFKLVYSLIVNTKNQIINTCSNHSSLNSKSILKIIYNLVCYQGACQGQGHLWGTLLTWYQVKVIYWPCFLRLIQHGDLWRWYFAECGDIILSLWCHSQAYAVKMNILYCIHYYLNNYLEEDDKPAICGAFGILLCFTSFLLSTFWGNLEVRGSSSFLQVILYLESFECGDNQVNWLHSNLDQSGVVGT